MAIEDDIAVLREVLALGPSPGPWTAYLGGKHARAGIQGPTGHICALTRRRQNTLKESLERGVELMQADAKFIAACSPERIQRLLDAVESGEGSPR